MTTTGERLGAAQLAGHRAIDAIYGPLADAVEAAVLSRATPDSDGTPRLSPLARFAIVNDIGRLIDAAQPDFFAAVRDTLALAIEAASAGPEPLSRQDVLAVVVPSYAPASRALIAARPGILRQAASLVAAGVVRRTAATEVAKHLRQYFSPFFAPRRDAKGALVRDRAGAVTSWPGRAGMASQHVRLVMLTESTAAHGRTMRRLADRDGTLLRYTLSLRHTDRDRCDENARADVGFGPGLYLPGEAPSVPAHPRCRCYFEQAEKVPTFPEEQMRITGLRRGFPIP